MNIAINIKTKNYIGFLSADNFSYPEEFLNEIKNILYDKEYFSNE